MNFRYEFISKSSENAMKRLKHFDFGDHVWCSPPYLYRLLHAYREKKQKSLIYSVCDDFFVSFHENLSLLVFVFVLSLLVYSMNVCCRTYFQVNCDRELLLNFLFYWIWMPPDIGCWTFQKKKKCENKYKNTHVKSTFNWIWMRLNIGQSWTFQNKYVPSQFTLFKETTSLL